MDLECEVRQPDLIIVMKGANDSAWSKSRNDNIVPFERFKINLQKILEVAQKHKSKIVFIGIIPHDEGKLSPLPWEHERITMYRSFAPLALRSR
jgi:lysophospholipase L1-like esterase